MNQYRMLMDKKLDTIESVVHEYHTQRLRNDISEHMTVAEARELILAIVARDMILEGGTVIHLEYET